MARRREGEARFRDVSDADGALRSPGRFRARGAGRGGGAGAVAGMRRGLDPAEGVEKPDKDSFGRVDGPGEERAMGLYASEGKPEMGGRPSGGCCQPFSPFWSTLDPAILSARADVTLTGQPTYGRCPRGYESAEG